MCSTGIVRENRNGTFCPSLEVRNWPPAAVISGPPPASLSLGSLSKRRAENPSFCSAYQSQGSLATRARVSFPAFLCKSVVCSCADSSACVHSLVFCLLWLLSSSGTISAAQKCFLRLGKEKTRVLGCEQSAYVLVSKAGNV